ncbi:MAG: FkbM family methyltransferase [Bacteroidia bacterium]|nr:FkbM family methyltransferase [Bacteroidia bacterium]
MKALLQRILQYILGYDRYLWIFTLYKLKTLKYDEHENDFFHFVSLLPKEAIVLDIGANLGLMSYYLSKSSKKVYAFEPMPNNYEVIEKLKTRYKLDNLQILKNALGNKNQKIQLVLPVVDGVKKQGLSHVVDEKMTEFNDGKLFETDCYKLDDVPQLKDETISAIKIDVENFEYEVFQGAEELIKKNKPIIYCELWNNQNRLDCFEFFSKLNYDRFVYVDKKLKAINGNPSDIQNFFFIPKQH